MVLPRQKFKVQTWKWIGILGLSGFSWKGAFWMEFPWYKLLLEVDLICFVETLHKAYWNSHSQPQDAQHLVVRTDLHELF